MVQLFIASFSGEITWASPRLVINQLVFVKSSLPYKIDIARFPVSVIIWVLYADHRSFSAVVNLSTCRRIDVSLTNRMSGRYQISLPQSSIALWSELNCSDRNSVAHEKVVRCCVELIHISVLIRKIISAIWPAQVILRSYISVFSCFTQHYFN
jgi:hypothetical protein